MQRMLHEMASWPDAGLSCKKLWAIFRSRYCNIEEQSFELTFLFIASANCNGTCENLKYLVNLEHLIRSRIVRSIIYRNGKSFRSARRPLCDWNFLGLSTVNTGSAHKSNKVVSKLQPFSTANAAQ